MKVEKDGVVKEVDNALVPDYITAGWKKADIKSKKEVATKRAEEAELEAKLQGK